MFTTKAEVIKPYAAERDDELDLEKGEMVLLDLSTQTEDGWFFAQRRGNAGLIPSNYVRVLRDRSSKFPPSFMAPP